MAERASVDCVCGLCEQRSASRAHTGIWVRWGAQLGDYSPLVVAAGAASAAAYPSAAAACAAAAAACADC